MKRLVLLATLAVSGVLFADPIQDSVVHGYKAAWMPSGGVPCATICRQADASNGEREEFVIASLSNKLTYVCKGKTETGAPAQGQGTLYGNNFNSNARNKFCMVSTADGTAQRLNRFFCLCIY